MKKVDDAYQVIATVLSQAASDQLWEYLEVKAPILTQNLGGTTTSQKLVDGGTVDVPVSWAIFDIQKAALFLRDHILHTTGRRIWGLTFKLYPGGKFDVEYDYDKPADYDDSDDPISLAEAQKRLADNGIQTTVKVSPDTPEQRFLAAAFAHLQTSTAEHGQRWGLGTESSWHLDMHAGLLQLNFADGRELQFQVQVIGTYNRRDDTFLWGWDHPSVPEPLRRAAQHVRAYGAREGFDRFTTRTVSCTENDAWDFTAAAAQLDGVTGAYRGDAGGAWIYMTFDARALQAP